MVSCDSDVDSGGSGSDVDTDDEDFKRALAESLLYAGGSGAACVGVAAAGSQLGAGTCAVLACARHGWLQTQCTSRTVPLTAVR